MTFRTNIFALCLASSAACIFVGYAMTGAWPGACLSLLPCVLAAFHRRLSAPWVPTAFLACMVGIAAAGLFLGAAAFLMIAGAALALGTWDLANLERSIKGDGPAAPRFKERPRGANAPRFKEHPRGANAPRFKDEWRHIHSLALALGAGLFAAACALVLPLRLPFLVMFLLLILDLFCLERLARFLAARTERHP
jgi:hypothetical protein